MGSNLFEVGDPPPQDGYNGPRVEVPSCPPPAAVFDAGLRGFPGCPGHRSRRTRRAVGPPLRAPSDVDPSVLRRAGGRDGLIAAAVSVLLVATFAFALGGEPAGPAGSSGQPASGPMTPESQPGAGTFPDTSGAPQSGSKLSLGRLDVAAISAGVDPAVVDITATLAYGGGRTDGTGMVVTPTGEVLTNNHVIEGAAVISAQIDGRGPIYKATLIATDPTADIALIQLGGVSGLKTVSVGDSSSVAVGEPVVAIGNALDVPGPPKVTLGTITARDVPIDAEGSGSSLCETLNGMFEFDAPLEPGNSGGPLLDSEGQVIGIDTAASGSHDTFGILRPRHPTPVSRYRSRRRSRS